MAGLINQLLTTLEQQAQNYEDLAAIAREKHQVLVLGDITSLQKITDVESMLVGHNQQLEKSRIAITRDIATVLAQNEGLTLERLAELMANQPEHPSLVAVAARLRIALTLLKQANDINRPLISFALDYAHISISLVRDASIHPYNPTYNA